MKRVAALLLVPALLAGCGSGKSGQPSAEKTTYLARAEAICAQTNAAIAALPLPGATAAVIPYAQSVLTQVTTAQQQLSALTPPAADRATLETKVLVPLQAELTQGQQYVQRLTAAGRAKNSKAFTDLVANPPTKSTADLVWMKNYGFNTCVTALAR
jgi:hypothetical protein